VRGPLPGRAVQVLARQYRLAVLVALPLWIVDAYQTWSADALEPLPADGEPSAARLQPLPPLFGRQYGVHDAGRPGSPTAPSMAQMTGRRIQQRPQAKLPAEAERYRPVDPLFLHHRTAT
jgi:hypothetical protein